MFSWSFFIFLSLFNFEVFSNQWHEKSSKGIRYDNYHLFRIKCNSNISVEKLNNWLEKFEEKQLSDKNSYLSTHQNSFDIWSPAHNLKPYADVLVSPEIVYVFKEKLINEGFNNYKIIHKNVQKHLEGEKKNLQNEEHTFRRKKRSIDDSSLFFNIFTYNSVDNINKYMINMVNKYPQYSQLLNVTKTYENRDMLGIKIGIPGIYKPAIIIDAGVHAREWIAPASAIYIINQLLTMVNKDNDIKYVIEKFDWYIIPLANPDGYQYSMEQDRMWRKTRSINKTISKWCIGADANRNWGYKWGEIGANRSPCSNIYSGSEPFSEIETKGLKNFITYNVYDPQIYISLHSYGQVFLAPWGYTNDLPINHKDQKNAALMALDAIKNISGAEYMFGTISEMMYPASGTSIDYMQNYGVPYIYGIELRPGDDDIYGFIIPSKFIEPSGKEVLSACIKLCRYALSKSNLN
ncbi:Peptidase M14, carboxypeptidase A domain and Proteinase inhibitor, carboxypeptidase propeptide domain and Proteinase inhibitor, propeptide domain-containing protein [Strongyloides ratti]|uniref:Peptidase M14, carboxypeptidase A domain and Proteinase inhibitor, carboxypeptidase propeptide domain and Proteinase inhibitor, propeptide domain-containing protein n=1 Tax=Strongyloides ratti TaxID=34506 RepID=A0A090KX19_STRRB|nr:Peptidase M14, carboxypeptidase A domain and Proteinase inhibitor, carboxypeptidase propeptide domain and Proteinase inhibitor, propeptide domain-containing protein [Strongyloides ratti]CEF59762.1 Peptidase M14, carboxypeptidase A domain and Proteinase inhibitor, carboxypeptidase propeptide domain and Proteinase inhibitor, propeptide domain-containing protein [Strongyloides ratti]